MRLSSLVIQLTKIHVNTRCKQGPGNHPVWGIEKCIWDFCPEKLNRIWVTWGWAHDRSLIWGELLLYTSWKIYTRQLFHNPRLSKDCTETVEEHFEALHVCCTPLTLQFCPDHVKKNLDFFFFQRRAQTYYAWQVSLWYRPLTDAKTCLDTHRLTFVFPKLRDFMIHDFSD